MPASFTIFDYVFCEVQMPEEQTSFSVPYQQGQLVKTMLGGLVMAIAITWWSWTSWHQEIKTIANYLAIIFGPPVALGCALGFLGTLRLLIQNRPGLEVTLEGITYHHLFLGTQRMSWNDIRTFELRDNETGRGRIETTLFILPHPGVKRSIAISVGNLATNSESLIESLQSFSATIDSDRVGKPVTDKRPSYSFQQYSIWGGIGGTIIWAVFAIGSRLVVNEANKAVVNHQIGASAIDAFDNAAKESPFLVAIKRSYPAEYEQLRNEVRAGIEKNATQEEMDAKVSTFGQNIMRQHLRHASSATIKRYLLYRSHLFEKIKPISLEALYSLISQDKIDMGTTANEQAQITQAIASLDNDLASIIEAPSSQKIVMPNESLIEQRMLTIRKRLSNDEIDALAAEGTPDIHKGAFCNAYLHLYREILSLPDDEVVLIFRGLNQIPQDDRIPPE